MYQPLMLGIPIREHEHHQSLARWLTSNHFGSHAQPRAPNRGFGEFHVDSCRFVEPSSLVKHPIEPSGNLTAVFRVRVVPARAIHAGVYGDALVVAI